MKRYEVDVKTSDEVKAMTAENTTFSAAEVARIEKLEYIAKAIEKEIKALKGIAIEKYGKNYESTLLKTKTSIYRIFDSKLFIEENGEEEYEKYKTEQERTTVTFQ